jgi:hypothetical protein
VRFLSRTLPGKVHALRCTDDLGTQAASIMSPKTSRALLKPYYARIAALCHENDMQVTVPTGDRARIHADLADQLRHLATPSGGVNAVDRGWWERRPRGDGPLPLATAATTPVAPIRDRISHQNSATTPKG